MTYREHALEKFQVDVKPIEDEFGKEAVKLGKTIVELAKEKDLPYVEAYAGLEYAYRLMRYQSQFVRTK